MADGLVPIGPSAGLWGQGRAGVLGPSAYRQNRPIGRVMTPGEGGGTSRADPADLPTVYGPQRLLQRLPRSAESANRPIGGVIRPGEGRGLGLVVMGHWAWLWRKKTALPHKRRPIFKITLQLSHFGSLFFLSVYFPSPFTVTLWRVYSLWRTWEFVPKLWVISENHWQLFHTFRWSTSHFPIGNNAI